MVYGTGTRSYNRSTEKREMDRQRREYNEKLQSGEIKFEPVVILVCHCRSFRFSHEVKAHIELKSDYDWRLWQQRQGDSRDIWDRSL